MIINIIHFWYSSANHGYEQKKDDDDDTPDIDTTGEKDVK
jgi:hypothetical protein